MKKSSTPIEKKSGPNTAKGKLVSSQNAIKAGLTTKQLLNEQEFTRFSQLKDDLNKHYSGTNPLIQLQIEKIARLQIQLERIQNAIDALYRKSEMEPSHKPREASSIRDSATIGLHLYFLLGLFDETAINKIENTLLAINLQTLFAKPAAANHSEGEDEQPPILTQSSLLGAYLYAEASHYQQEVSAYLKDKGTAVAYAQGAKDLYQKLNFEVLNNAIDLMESPSPEAEIVMQDSYEYYQFKSWFEKELAKLPELLSELRLLIRQRENPIHIALPDFDNLDRLMRYQTNISRQLSTAIGELMILAKQ